VNDLYDCISDPFNCRFCRFPHHDFAARWCSRQCRLFRRVACLVSRHAPRQVFRCTTGQVQINVSPITSKACTPPTTLWLQSVCPPHFNPALRPAIHGNVSSKKASGLGTFHMTLTIGFCSFTRVPNDSVRLATFIKRWHQPTTTFRCGCLIDHWSTKYTRRL